MLLTGNEGTHFIASPTMMVAPMQTAYSNFPQQVAQHFQPQSPVYTPQVIHPTMMVQDPMVRHYNVIHNQCCCIVLVSNC